MPLVRSRNQLLVLGHLMVWADREWSSPEIVAATGVSQASVSRELSRLSDSGIILRRMVGRTLLVQTDLTTPVFEPLRALMMLSYGPVPVLTELLSGVEGVEEAHIVGSWAHRLAGVPGHWPHDVDVAVIGTVHDFDLTHLLVEAEQTLGLPVQATVVTREKWEGDGGFVADVRNKPMVALDLRQ